MDPAVTFCLRNAKKEKFASALQGQFHTMAVYLQLNTVTPAQRSGQNTAGSTSSGTGNTVRRDSQFVNLSLPETTASVRSVTYSAYPPSRVTPLTGRVYISTASGEGIGEALTLFFLAHLE